MQFYVLIPLIFLIISRFFKSQHTKTIMACLIGISSLLLYLFVGTSAQKFYYLPFRLFEFCAGVLARHVVQGCNYRPYKRGIMKVIFVILYLFLVVFLFQNSDFIGKSIRLLLTVAISAIVLILMPRVSLSQNKIISNTFLAILGAASYSLFVWHQVVFAITRYSFTSNITDPMVAIIMFGIIVLLTLLTYKYIEPLKISLPNTIIMIVLFISTTTFSLLLYANAGVVKDIPELDVSKSNAVRGQWASYCDRGYQYDRAFSESYKQKWFVIGNSYGRDFVNIIIESPISDLVEVSYSPVERLEHCDNRFEEADIVFVSTLGVDDDLIQKIRGLCKTDTKLVVVGEKNFGECNGQVYRRRFDDDYLQMAIQMKDGFLEKNIYLKQKYGDSYIDMIEIVKADNDYVRVFTNEGKYISQDCAHLTRAGAVYYAGKIDWNRFIEY